MYVHTPSQSLILKVRDPLQIRELMPAESRTVSLPDGHNIQLKWTLDSAKLLRNIGIAAPSPITSFYRFPRPPHYDLPDDQVSMASFQTLNDKCFNLSEPGSGKTAATCWAADYLMEIGVIKRALITCPLTSMKLTWQHDLFEILPHRTSTIVHGDMDRRWKNLSRKVDFYIMNHDGLDLERLAVEIRKRPDIGLVVVDEADVLCNAKTDVYRFLKWIMERKTKLWLLTGTPTPNAPTDAWALSKLINPSLSPQFEGRFKDETMQQVSTHRWVPKAGADQRAFEIMQPAIRIMKDRSKLPPFNGPHDMPTTLSDEQKVALKSMKDEMTMFAKKTAINAVNGADKLAKLRQILCGSVKDPNTGLYHHLDCAPRIRDLRKLMGRAQGKRLVIAPFKGIVQLLGTELPKPDQQAGLPGYRVLTLNGDVPAAKRAGIVEQFKTDPEIDGLLCHPKVMSHGLNLTEADMTIFYGPINSNRQYLQVIERFFRRGQKFPMWLLRMVAHPIEASIYKVVDGRGTMQRNILDLYDEFITGSDEL